MHGLSQDQNYSSIQAFPIHKGTVQGVQTDLDIKEFRLIHADEDTDVTITFTDASTVVVSLLTGEDVGIGAGASTLTTSGSVKVS